MKDSGIERTQSHRWQQIADIPEERFDDYCRERWGMTYRHAHRLIEASRTIENVTHGSENGITSERQLRPLTQLDEAESQV